MPRPHLAIAATCVAWGTIPLVAAEVDLPGAAIAASRVWIASLGLGLLLLGRRLAGRPQPGAPLLSYRPLRTVACGLVLAVHWSAMFAGYRAGADATVIFIVFLAPVGIALLAPRTLGEAVGRRTVAALALALAGFGLVAGPDLAGDDGSATAVAWAALAAATFVALVLLSKPLAAAYGGLRLSLQQMTVAGIALLPVAAVLEWGPPRAAWWWLLLLGLGHTAVGTAVYLAVLGRIPATHVGILGYLEPVGVVAFAWLLAGQAPAPATVAGGAMIVAAGALVLRGAASAEVPVPAPVRPSEVAAHVPR